MKKYKEHHLLLFGLPSRLLLAVLVLPLANLTHVGYLLVQLGEDEVENLAVPFHRVAFDALFDVLMRCVVSHGYRGMT